MPTASAPAAPQRAARGLRQRILSEVSVPVGAVGVALAFGAVALAVLGANPITGLTALGTGSFGGGEELSRTVGKAIPLMLVASGICVAFRASVINIGGEGQIVIGAITGTTVALGVGDRLPSVIALPVVLAAGFIGGAAMGAVPGALKAYLKVNEILSTIMLNIVASQLMNFLLRGPMIDPAQDDVLNNIPQTRRLPASTDLPIIVPGTRIHLGLLVAIGAAIGAWFILWRTTLGFRLRAVGYSPEAARYGGMPVERNIVAALSLSGGFCGLAGAVLVFGSESHRLFTDGSAAGFTGDAGFNGIIAALFGALHPIVAMPASVLFGALLVGANQMQRDVQVPAALITALNGLIVIFVVSSARFKRGLLRRWSNDIVTPPPEETAPAVQDEGAALGGRT